MILIKPLSYSDFISSIYTFDEEISVEKLFEKVCLLIVSYYSIAAEIRFTNIRGEIKARVVESENWHLLAIEIGEKLLSSDSCLLSHLKNNYFKHYKSSSNLNQDFNKRNYSNKEKINEKSIKKLYYRSSSVKPANCNKAQNGSETAKIRTRTPVMNSRKSNRLIVRPTKAVDKHNKKTDRMPVETTSNFSKTVESVKQFKTELLNEIHEFNFTISNTRNKESNSRVSDNESNYSESIDIDFIRENFILNSKDLYGDSIEEIHKINKATKSNKNNKVKYKNTDTSETTNESKGDFMPLIRLINQDH